MSVVVQLIPNQSNRRSTVQWYFPLYYSIISIILEKTLYLLLPIILYYFEITANKLASCVVANFPNNVRVKGRISWIVFWKRRAFLSLSFRTAFYFWRFIGKKPLALTSGQAAFSETLSLPSFRAKSNICALDLHLKWSIQRPIHSSLPKYRIGFIADKHASLSIFYVYTLTLRFQYRHWEIKYQKHFTKWLVY